MKTIYWHYGYKKKKKKKFKRLKKKEGPPEEPDLKLALSLKPRECSLCLEEVDVDFMQSLSCSHEFCRTCLQEYLQNALKSRELPFVCPAIDCKKEIVEADLVLILDSKLIEEYSNHTLSKFIENHPDTYSCCPTPDCPYLFFFSEGEFDFHCPKCKQRYCLKCQVTYHTGSTCEAYRKWMKENGKAEELFSEFVVGMKWKQCPGCKKWVEKNKGCDHIICRCGFEFCYKCGGVYLKCECVRAEKLRRKMKKQKMKQKSHKKHKNHHYHKK